MVPLDLYYYCLIYLPFIDGDMSCLHTFLWPYLLTEGRVYNVGNDSDFQPLPHTHTVNILNFYPNRINQYKIEAHYCLA